MREVDALSRARRASDFEVFRTRYDEAQAFLEVFRDQLPTLMENETLAADEDSKAVERRLWSEGCGAKAI
jgi:hypothetical protein